MISLESVNEWFGDRQVLRDCTLTIANGEVVVICGPSDSAKSTLIKCINGLERVQSGSIHVDSEPVTQSSAALLRLRRRVSMVFQSFELYPHMKVIDNITLAPVADSRGDRRPGGPHSWYLGEFGRDRFGRWSFKRGAGENADCLHACIQYRVPEIVVHSARPG
jgi:ABC-type Fe3+/spermidine/putrescine transport system ATPase subunit